MSLNFSRRSFFRFLATAVMTVACVGLLAGCGSDSSKPTCDGDGKITNLNVTVKAERNTDDDSIFHFNIKVERDNDVQVRPDSFWIAVDHDDTVTYYNYSEGVFSFSNLESSEDVEYNTLPVSLIKNEKLDLDLTIDSSKITKGISEGDDIYIYYMPDIQYPKYISGWIYQW